LQFKYLGRKGGLQVCTKLKGGMANLLQRNGFERFRRAGILTAVFRPFHSRPEIENLPGSFASGKLWDAGYLTQSSA
jgi:hypothetical protein